VNADTDGRSLIDTTQEIRALAKLHDEGILTNDEFEAKKRQILGL
jgi:hypothetical protein